MTRPALRPGLRPAVLLAPLIVVGVLGTVADWLAPALITAHPLLVVALDPKIRYLALTAERVTLAVWFAAGFVRLFATDPLWYLLGRWYGEDAAMWLDRRLGLGQVLGRIERWFSRASGPIVAVAPDGLVCMLAGAAGMSPATFVVLDVLGTIGRLALVRGLAATIPSQISGASRLVGRYAWWLVGMSVVLAGIRIWRHSRHRAVADPAAPGRIQGSRGRVGPAPGGGESNPPADSRLHTGLEVRVQASTRGSDEGGPAYG